MAEPQETALAVRPPALSGYIPPPAKDEFEAMISMANTLAKAQGFLPAHFFGQPYKILAAILYGRDLGISATNALQHIIVIDGKATADAQLIGMLVRRAGHRLEDKTTDQASTVTITRDDGSKHEVTFTMADAQRAGLVRAGGAWTKYPAAMLYARALTACARKGAQDALMGTIYTPEELGVETVEDGQASPSAAPLPDITIDGEILNPSVASQEAVQSNTLGVEAAPSLGGPTPTAAVATPPAPSVNQGRSVGPSGPRAKRGNVVTAPQAVEGAQKSAQAAAGAPNPAVAPEGIRQVAPAQPASAPSTAPEARPPLQEAVAGTLEEIRAKIDKRKPDGGEEAFLATLRQQARESAAVLRQLRVRLENVSNEVTTPLPPTTPNSDSDASLDAYISDAYGKDRTLATLNEAELAAMLGKFEELTKRVEAKLKS